MNKFFLLLALLCGIGVGTAYATPLENINTKIIEFNDNSATVQLSWNHDDSGIPQTWDISASRRLNGTLRIDLFSNGYNPIGGPNRAPFGRIWMFDINSLIYTSPHEMGTQRTIFQNGAILTDGPLSSNLMIPPCFFEEDDAIGFRIIQIGKTDASLLPKNEKEAEELIMQDIACICEGLSTLIQVVDHSGYKSKDDLLKDCITHLERSLKPTTLGAKITKIEQDGETDNIG